MRCICKRIGDFEFKLHLLHNAPLTAGTTLSTTTSIDARHYYYFLQNTTYSSFSCKNEHLTAATTGSAALPSGRTKNVLLILNLVLALALILALVLDLVLVLVLVLSLVLALFLCPLIQQKCNLFKRHLYF